MRPPRRRGRSSLIPPAASAPSGAQIVKKRSWQSLRGAALGGGVVLVAAAAIVAFLLSYEPTFYRQAMAAAADGPENEARARRLVTKASALHAAVMRGPAPAAARPGRWETAIRDDELNAWLAIDLPRSHPSWLPRGVVAPRLAFRPRHAAVGVRVGRAPFTAVASGEFEIVLRDVNQFGIVLEQARLGAIPLPRAALVRDLERRIGKLGLPTDLRRLDGRLMLVVHVPTSRDAGASSHRIESLSLTEGELLMAGTVRTSAEPLSGDTRLPP